MKNSRWLLALMLVGALVVVAFMLGQRMKGQKTDVMFISRCRVTYDASQYAPQAFEETNHHFREAVDRGDYPKGIALICAYPLMKATEAPAPHVLINITSEYNARQGLSWVGGKGLTVTNSKFNHTGRATFMSAPGAGVDIEAEESVCRDGMFA
jgi:hypothetical protein